MYDANGDQVKVSETNQATGATAVDTYKYDELNQLIRIDGRDGSKSEYTYYATGLRASKNVDNHTSVFIYDGKEILAEITAEGTKTNIYGNNMLATTGADTLYYQYNNHGDVVRVLDQSGTLKNEYDYDAFGNAITEKETVKNPYRYAGYYQDTESGLYYLRSRYYNPKTARFLTEDTASGKYTDPLSLNKYTYCHNQPVTGYDPDGHALHILAGAVIGGLIGGAMSYASQAWKNKSFTKGINWKQVAGSAAEGAITGAIGAATGGASIAATAAKSGLKTATKFAAKKIATNTASGFIANSANQLISSGGKSYNVKEAFVSGLSENIDIPGGDAAEKTAKKVGSEITDKVFGMFKKKAGNEAAESAGSQIVKKTFGNSAESGLTSAGVDVIPTKQITPDSSSVLNGYHQDAKGRWHRPNGQYASNSEVGISKPQATKSKTSGKGGRLGNEATRKQNEDIAKYLSDQGYEIIGGGNIKKEEYLPGIAGKKKGSNYIDITAKKGDITLRINTIDTYANGLPTAREQAAADLINSKIGGGLILIAKGKGLGNLPQIIDAN